MKKFLAVLAALVAAATVLGAVACFLAGIWVHGPDSDRWVNTGFLLMFVSFGTVVAAVAAWVAALDG